MKRWFKMQLAADDNDTGEIMIYDMIGKDPWTGEGMDASDFDTELKALGPVKNINLRINSPGGYVSDGIAIHTMLRNHPAEVTASIDGIAASCASLVAMAGDNIVMAKNSFLLIHKPSTFAWGTDEDLMAAAADLERMGAVFANTYAARSGQTPEEATALMGQDRLMGADEAMSLGYCNEVSDPVKMAASYDMKFLPAAARAVMSAAIDTVKAEEEAEAARLAAVAIAEQESATKLAAEAAIKAAETASAAAAALKENVPGYGETEIHATLDLCKLAGMSDKASDFIKAKAPLDDVRAKLLAAKATKSDALDVDTTPAETPSAHRDEQKKLMQAKLREEMGIGTPVGKRPIKA